LTRSLNRLVAVLLILFMAVAGALTYWGVIASDDLLRRADNPRRVEAEQAIQRGAIYDKDGQLLVQSIPQGKTAAGRPIMIREYLHPEAISAIGYWSLVHGVGGSEEAFDTVLRGESKQDAWSRAVNAIMHRPQIGSDVRLTLDLSLERVAVAALRGHKGAIVVIEVPTGAVRTMVSAPSFDPNTLDTSFDSLLKDPSAPLLNRVMQGVYQPGGVIQTPILSALLIKGETLDKPTPGVEVPLKANGLTIACVAQPAVQILISAFANTCPRPFSSGTVTYPVEVQASLEAFGLLRAPRLVAYRTQLGSAATPLPSYGELEDRLWAEGAGQGSLTVTPLQMGMVAATIANHGSEVPLHMGDATRAPGADWQVIAQAGEPQVVTSRDVANSIRLAMREAVVRGAAQAAAREGETIFGHASFAYSGPPAQADTPQAAPTSGTPQNAISWFIGFIDLSGGRSAAIAVVLEDTLDPAEAANIGGTVLLAAATPP
jgi:peptidoglycan glycosyltransferase